MQLFIRVDSVPGYVTRAERLGARTIIAPQTLPGGDVLAILLDPQGSRSGSRGARGRPLALAGGGAHFVRVGASALARLGPGRLAYARR